MIGTDGACAVAQIGLQLHQGAIADLLKRLQLNPAARGIHRPGQVPATRPRLAQQIAQADALPLDLGPGIEQPVLVHAGQQVAPVFGDGRGGVHQDPAAVIGSRGGQGSLPLDIENTHVDTAGVRVTPAQVP